MIKRSAAITDAKAAKLHSQISSALPTDPCKAKSRVAELSHLPGDHAEHAEADISNPGVRLSRDPAEHAEADSPKPEGEEVGVSGSSVSASSELITPEIEKLLPSATRRVSVLAAPLPVAYEPSAPPGLQHPALQGEICSHETPLLQEYVCT